jgi:diguanylate cyclase (GGDEF)-like protein
MLLLGGAQIVWSRYHVVSSEIARSLTFQTLARRDDLTKLPNRLAMREWYIDHIDNGDMNQPFVLYCIDLDGFKPVNDVFGHVIGDALLKGVATRLKQAVPNGDLVTRMGGDEFAVIQRNVVDSQQAADFAAHLRDIISVPFVIKEHRVAVSACIGYTLSRSEVTDLERLIYLADMALYDAKNRGRGVIDGRDLRQTAA